MRMSEWRKDRVDGEDWSIEWRKDKIGSSVFSIEDTEWYDTGINALKRWHYVVEVSPYKPGYEDQYLVMLKRGKEMMHEQELYDETK